MQAFLYRLALLNTIWWDSIQGAILIRCNLSRILGEKKIKVAELSRATNIHKNIIHRLYNEEIVRVDINVVETLCRYLQVSVGEFFELEDDINEEQQE